MEKAHHNETRRWCNTHGSVELPPRAFPTDRWPLGTELIKCPGCGRPNICIQHLRQQQNGHWRGNVRRHLAHDPGGKLRAHGSRR